VIDAVALTCRSARAAGARVVHCRAVVRPDRAGRLNNCRILAASAKGADAIELGTPGADVMPELEPSPDDIDMPRLHGLTPFTGTSLDRVLRNMGVSTVVATGNSVNIGVLGLVLSAVDLGYQVVVPRDAVAGVPSSYAEAVLDNTVSLLATLTTSAQLAEVWAGSPDR
jgi:nicotinamidase-related amidase